MKWEGLNELNAKLRKAQFASPLEMAKALTVEANLIMTEAKRRTPVAPDGGTLRNSGHVKDAVIMPKSASITMGFGGAASAYALAVHEHPSEYSPPSWEGKIINWNAYGSGPKFLESAVNDAVPGFGQRIRRHLTLFT